MVRGSARSAAIIVAVGFVAAIALFATLNTLPARPSPLANTMDSPEAVGAAVLNAMGTRDFDRLRALALTKDEFQAHVWPYLRISRPEVNMPFDFAWNMLQQHSNGYLRQTAAGIGDAPSIRRVEFTGAVSRYGEVTVHRDSALIVAGDDGRERRVRLLGSMIEQGGRWKVFSYVVDD